MQAENEVNLGLVDAGGAGAASAGVARALKATAIPVRTPRRHTSCGEATATTHQA
jgi:hypothetical protein